MYIFIFLKNSFGDKRGLKERGRGRNSNIFLWFVVNIWIKEN